MQMPKLSLTIIARNEESNLPRLLASVAQYVDEVIVCDTGSEDRTKEIARDLGCVVVDCNPQTHPQLFFVDDGSEGSPPPHSGKPTLGNFAGARQVAESVATGEYVLWLDCDDTLEGAEHLLTVVDNMASTNIDCVWLPYHYGHDAAGRVICLLSRERIYRRGTMKWVNPIHEVMVPTGPNVKSSRLSEMVVRHHRSADRTATVANRNYKVLARHVKLREDARTLFYFANEAKFINPDQAIAAYERYVEISGWPEERSLARCYLGELYEDRKHLGKAQANFSAAATEATQLPDGWFGLARMAFHRKDWGECIRLTEEGLKRGTPETVVMINPLSRSYGPFVFYSIALNAVGRVQDAHDAAMKGLAVIPEDRILGHNVTKFREFLDVQAAAGNSAPGLTQQAREAISVIAGPQGHAVDPAPISTPVLRSMALRLWKELLAHDEGLKAREFLQALPISITEDPEVERAREVSNRVVEHLQDDALNCAFILTEKATEAITVETTLTPLDHPGQFVRYGAVLDTIQKAFPSKRLRIFDIGCQDGWMSNRLARMGHRVVGVDLSPDHLEIARRNAERLSLDARFIVGNFENLLHTLGDDDREFDLIVCTEVVEHLLSPEVLFYDLCSYMAEGARLVVTTPLRSWLGGQQLAWAPGWNKPKEHVRCWTARSLREAMVDAGLSVDDVTSMPIPKPDVPGQATLIAIGQKRNASQQRDLDIVIWTGPGVEPWSPHSPKTTGIGGSETACIELARHFVRMGHRVTVYGDPRDQEGWFDGVEYRRHDSLVREKCDVFISSRQPAAADLEIEARLRLLWVHDIHVGAPSPDMHRWLLRYDRILCLTEWHKQFLLRCYPHVHQDTVVVTRNGIDASRFLGDLPPKRNKLIYSSSANRGLDVLLDVFPTIKAEVPDVELHVFYGFESWEATARQIGDAAQLEEIARYRARLANTPGVIFRGRVDQKTLADEMKDAKVLAYPTNFTETFMISAIEAQAAGCVPVTSALAALPETARWGILIPGNNGMPEYQQQFIAGVVGLLKDEDKRATIAAAARQWALGLTWESLAREWEAMFRDLFDDCAGNVPRYAGMVGIAA